MAQPTFTIIYLICLYNQLPQQQLQIFRLVCFMGKTKTHICVKVFVFPITTKIVFSEANSLHACCTMMQGLRMMPLWACMYVCRLWQQLFCANLYIFKLPATF